jgi:uncharacterized protein (DUF2062 family)
LARLPGSPYAIAGGFAWGAAVSFTPFIGLHFILGAIFSWMSRCSIIASAIGTAIGNPWTFPFIWAFVYSIGTSILRMDETATGSPMESLSLFFDQLWDLAGNSLRWMGGLIDASEISAGGTWDSLQHLAVTVFWPLFVGSIPVAAIAWIVFYLPLKYLVAGYQTARRHRMERKKSKGRVKGNKAMNGNGG